VSRVRLLLLLASLLVFDVSMSTAVFLVPVLIDEGDWWIPFKARYFELVGEARAL
jgi:hypothetical protein